MKGRCRDVAVGCWTDLTNTVRCCHVWTSPFTVNGSFDPEQTLAKNAAMTELRDLRDIRRVCVNGCFFVM